MTYIIQSPEPVSLPVAGSGQRFPVNNIFCVGRNYADHAVEMGGDPDREPPFFFIKPAFALLADNKAMRYPACTGDLHHEVELVAALGDPGVFGYAVGVDMTRRDLQSQAKEKGRPWDAGKSFVHAAPCGAVQPAGGELHEAAIQLSVNGETRQSGNINQMIWKLPEIIERLAELFILQPGDLIFTGTPAGVGQVRPDDQIEAQVAGLPSLSFKVSS